MRSLRHLNLISLLFLSSDLVRGDDTCPDKTDAVKLKKALLCGYDRTVRPVLKHTDTINVSFVMIVRHFSYYQHSNVLYLNSWVGYNWYDQLLKWDPKAYNGVRHLYLESEDIWVPDFTVVNLGEMGGVYHRIPSTSCLASCDGLITCFPPTSYSANCVPDLTRWPFDTQTCIVDVASWAHSGNNVNMTVDNEPVKTEGMVKNLEWNLLSTKAIYKTLGYGNDTFPLLSIRLKLERHSRGYAATVVIPAFVLALLTILMFLLDPVSSERLSLGCMSVITHCLYLQYLGFVLPYNGVRTPLIVAFFRDSLLLVSMSMLTAIILRLMLTTERTPPAWLGSSASWILESTLGRWIILQQCSSPAVILNSSEDDNGLAEGATSSSPKKNQWESIVLLLDRVCLIIFASTLVVFLMAFVP